MPSDGVPFHDEQTGNRQAVNKSGCIKAFGIGTRRASRARCSCPAQSRARYKETRAGEVGRASDSWDKESRKDNVECFNFVLLKYDLYGRDVKLWQLKNKPFYKLLGCAFTYANLLV